MPSPIAGGWRWPASPKQHQERSKSKPKEVIPINFDKLFEDEKIRRRAKSCNRSDRVFVKKDISVVHTDICRNIDLSTKYLSQGDGRDQQADGRYSQYEARERKNTQDNNDRILILKTMIDNEIITLVSFYDTNENKDCYLNTIDNLLRQIDASQGVIIGSDFNNFTDNIKDQKGNQAKPHYRTKATAKHKDWKESHKFIDIYRHNNPEGRDLTYLKDGNDRLRMDKGSRLDKFLVTEDLLIKEVS